MWGRTGGGLVALLRRAARPRPPAPLAGGRVALASTERGAGGGAVAFLDGLVNFERTGVPDGAGMDGPEGFELGRMHRLLAALDDPHRKWPVIHVAGTKGKGSTVTFLAGILRASGYRVGTYMSPHVTSLCERISTAGDGAHVGLDELDALVERHLGALERRQVAEGGRLSHFEIMTALAFAHFAREGVDVAVVEGVRAGQAGLGGVRDATNVFPTDGVVLSVLTSIGMEHAGALGGTLESIAAAKAGIAKPGRPVVLGRQSEAAAAAVVRRVAGALGSGVVLDAETQVSVKPRGFRLGGGTEGGRPPLAERCWVGGTPGGDAAGWDLGELQLQLTGAHQHANLAAATAAALWMRRHEGWRIGDEAIRDGLEGAKLPGRLQVLSEEQATGVLARCGAAVGARGSLPWVVLDGAHTPAAAAALGEALVAAFPGLPVGLVVAMAADKDHRAFARELSSSIDPAVVTVTQVQIAGGGARAAPPAELRMRWEDALGERPGGGRGCAPSVAGTLAEAVRVTAGQLGDLRGGVLCVTGSLHACAEASAI